MNISRQKVQSTLQHRTDDTVPVDFGATSVTGIHCKVVEGLRKHYGLDSRPVKIIEPFQMLGEIDEELKQIIGVDCENVFGSKNMFSSDETRRHEQITPWGQRVLISKDIDLTPDDKGDVYIYAKGDRSYPPSAVMPAGCYFMNAIERQATIDDNKLDVSDNLEEYDIISDEDLAYFEEQVNLKSKTGRAVVASFGGAALGDIAIIPGMGLEHPSGIRSVAEWYMSTVMRRDYIHQIFEKQVDIAIENYSRLWQRVGDKVDVVFTCGTDFGTQESQFCSPETYKELWYPHYRRMNDWIHENTTWKVFKHSCGAIFPLIPAMIESGFDILNPIQINAKDMDPKRLKEEFGAHLTFWGGGIDTQQVLPYGTAEEIKTHVKKQCEILANGGGFVFNAIHNIQANVPLENFITVIETINQINR